MHDSGIISDMGEQKDTREILSPIIENSEISNILWKDNPQLFGLLLESDSKSLRSGNIRGQYIDSDIDIKLLYSTDGRTNFNYCIEAPLLMNLAPISEKFNAAIYTNSTIGEVDPSQKIFRYIKYKFNEERPLIYNFTHAYIPILDKYISLAQLGTNGHIRRTLVDTKEPYYL